MFRIAVLLMSGNVSVALLNFARNLLVARLVSIEDYGIAATFAISMAVVEMASGLGLQQLIVQDRQGNDPNLQAGLQGFNFLRSLISGAVLFLLARPIANFLGIPEITWAYQLLALVPIVRGLEHFDLYRMSRRMHYRPLILTSVVPSLLSVLSLWPLFHLFGDYRVMLYAMLIQWVTGVVMSHLVAERRFEIRLDLAVMGQGLRFGWPIMVNNIMLFIVFQGDKMIVGRELGMASLGLFAMGITLTLTPTLIIASSSNQFFLPQLSATATKDPARFNLIAMATMQTSLIGGLALVAAVVLFGAPLIHFVLGEKFDPLIPLLTWFAILQAVRVYKVGGTVVAISKAHTGNAMIANTFRILSLPFAWYVVMNGGELLHVIWIATVGELFAFAVSLFLLHQHLKLNLRNMILPVLATFALTGTAAVHAALSQFPNEFEFWNSLIIMFLVATAIAAMRDLRSYVVQREITKIVD